MIGVYGGRETDMKKKLIIAAVLILILAAAIYFRFALAYVILGGEAIQIDRSEITVVSATSVTSVPVRIAELSESQIDSFVELINSLELKKLPLRNEKKGGWLYSFRAFREDGSFISVSFLDNGHITVDGYDCFTLRNVSGVLDEYFEGG